MSLTYVVEGVSFSDRGEALQGTTYGDKYLVLYNTNNPSECVINTTLPFFYKNEKLGRTKGQIVGRVRSRKEGKQGQIFEYQYIVDGIRCRREQQYITCGQSKTILRKGMEFVVKYSIDVPEKAIMVIDSTNVHVFLNFLAPNITN